MKKLEVKTLYNSGDFDIKRFDLSGNEIYFRNSDGFEECKKYNENNNIIFSKNSNGKNEWFEYDDNNNLIYKTDSDGIDEWKSYDDQNNLMLLKILMDMKNGINTSIIKLIQKELKDGQNLMKLES